VFEMTKSRVCRRSVKSMFVLVSTVTQVTPSVDPCRTQFFGSRPGTSSAEVSVYCLTATEVVPENWYVSVAVFANVSHFVSDVSSTRLPLPSFGVFSPLTVIVPPVARSASGFGVVVPVVIEPGMSPAPLPQVEGDEPITKLNVPPARMSACVM
jgi:hypothetical protein